MTLESFTGVERVKWLCLSFMLRVAFGDFVSNEAAVLALCWCSLRVLKGPDHSSGITDLGISGVFAAEA